VQLGRNRPRSHLDRLVGELVEKRVERHVVIVVVANAKLLAGHVDAPRRVELGREDPQVEVGHERAQQQHAVALLDELRHLGPPHRPFIQADVQRVLFRHDALAQQRGGDRNLVLLSQGQDPVLQAEAMNLDPRQDHRPLGLGQKLRGLFRGFFDDLRVGQGLAVMVGVHDPRHDLDQVAGNLDVARPLVAGDRVEHPVDLAEGDSRVVELGAGHAQLLEDLDLRPKVLHLVVQERIVDPLAHPRRAADDNDGRLLGVGPGDRVADRQPAHAVRDADRAEAVDPSVGVGREARAVLARAADDLDRAFFELAVKRENVVAGNPEDVLEAVVLKPPDQVLADRKPLGRPRGVVGRSGMPGDRIQSRHGKLLRCFVVGPACRAGNPVRPACRARARTAHACLKGRIRAPGSSGGQVSAASLPIRVNISGIFHALPGQSSPSRMPQPIAPSSFANSSLGDFVPTDDMLILVY
jgi:hypothetical protein